MLESGRVFGRFVGFPGAVLLGLTWEVSFLEVLDSEIRLLGSVVDDVSEFEEGFLIH